MQECLSNIVCCETTAERQILPSETTSIVILNGIGISAQELTTKIDLSPP